MQRVKKIIHSATSTPKRKRTSLVIFLVICGLIAGGVWYWNYYKKSIIKNEVDKSLSKGTNGLYTIAYSKFNLDELGGSLLVDSVKLQYDSVVYNRMVDDNNAPSLLFKVFVPQLSLTGVQTPKALIDKEVIGEKLQLLAPIIEIIYTGKGKDSTRNIPPEEVYRQLLSNLKLIRIKEIVISNATLITRKKNSSDTSLQVHNLTVNLTDALISDSTVADTSRILFAKSVALSIGRIEWLNKKKLYNYEVDNVILNSATRTLSLSAMKMVPQLSENDFMTRVGLQIDRFNLAFDSIQFINVNVARFFKESIEADSMVIHKASIKVYKDHNQPRDNVNRVGTFPHQIIQKLPVSINIRKAYLANAFIEYKQNTPKTGQKGMVQFYNASAVIDNITNQPEAIKANKICRADARCMFMNIASMRASFFFNLASDNGAFSVDGHLGEFNAEKLNFITLPLVAAKVEKGIIHGVDMKITGSDYVGHGTVTMLYEDLKISVLEKNEDDGKLDKKKLVSMAANIIIKNNNPGSDGKARIGTGEFQRDTNRGFFNLVWKSLFVALSDNIGAPAKSTPKK